MDKWFEGANSAQLPVQFPHSQGKVNFIALSKAIPAGQSPSVGFVLT